MTNLLKKMTCKSVQPIARLSNFPATVPFGRLVQTLHTNNKSASSFLSTYGIHPSYATEVLRRWLCVSVDDRLSLTQRAGIYTSNLNNNKDVLTAMSARVILYKGFNLSGKQVDLMHQNYLSVGELYRMTLGSDTDSKEIIPNLEISSEQCYLLYWQYGLNSPRITRDVPSRATLATVYKAIADYHRIC